MTAAPEFQWIALGTLLTASGVIAPEQLEHALEVREESGQRLGEVLVALGFTTGREIAGALADQYGLEFVDLDEIRPERRAVELLPEQLARRYHAIPLRLVDDVLVVGMADPIDLHAADDLRMAAGVQIQPAAVDPIQLDVALARAYRKPVVQLVGVEPVAVERARVEDIRDIASSVPTINLVNSLLTTAIEERGSDVHFEPGRESMLVRVRIDGVLREVATVPRHLQAAVCSRLKLMANLDIAERRLPQDGRVSAHFGGDPIDLRVAALPTRHGEQIVVRILSHRGGRHGLDALGMSDEAHRAFIDAISQPYGATIVCGPTGSGKTTTLYAALEHLNETGRSLMTIEDPIEHQLPGVGQVEVDTRAGLTFARGLRTILRSDPDVLLVGEIRDDETAAIAIQAAMTGHVVLTSLHAHTAAAAIGRLRDMGVEPGLLATSLNCIVAQRLLRRLCEECKEAYTAPGPDFGVAGEVEVFRARGCARCDGTGYRGRVALREVMPVQGDVRRLIEHSTDEIFAAAVRQGMTTLKGDGIRLCLDGICSPEEFRRVVGARLA